MYTYYTGHISIHLKLIHVVKGVQYSQIHHCKPGTQSSNYLDHRRLFPPKMPLCCTFTQIKHSWCIHARAPQSLSTLTLLSSFSVLCFFYPAWRLQMRAALFILSCIVIHSSRTRTFLHLAANLRDCVR